MLEELKNVPGVEIRTDHTGNIISVDLQSVSPQNAEEMPQLLLDYLRRKSLIPECRIDIGFKDGSTRRWIADPFYITDLQEGLSGNVPPSLLTSIRKEIAEARSEHQFPPFRRVEGPLTMLEVILPLTSKS